jgi:predicted membrane-bound spermidine synthase
MQLSAVTGYLTANIAPIPLLWILPLAVYLITLILAFEFPRLLPRGIVTRFLAVMLAGLGYMLSHVDVSLPVRFSIGFFLFELLVAGLFCHSEAYSLRPRRASESTVFYLLFAAGGALGSFLVGIAFPLLFRFNYDLAITFFVTALLALAATWTSNWGQRLLWSAASVMMLVLAFWLHTAYQRGTMVAVRNFYAALRVKQNYGFPGATLRTLTNGTIQHGTQIFGTDAQRKTPTTYYALDSGAGLALRLCCQGPDGSVNGSVRPRNIGVIGLGAGTLAAYGRPGDHIRFYEINPAVEPIARNAFTYLRESGAHIEIVNGDARTSLAREQPQSFDVLVVDAFSGDAIPLHLLTAEALALYRRHLAPGGIVAFHISNQHVDLEPAIALLARNAGMQAMRISSLANEDRGEFSANWVLVSDNAQFFAQPEVAAAARPPSFKPGLRLWTDDYSSLLPLLRW